MSTNRWLDELYNLREEDKARRQTEPEPLDLSVLTAQREKQAADVLRQADAHNLLRRVQRALLDGKGIIDIFEHKSNYERLITLVWQGSVSMARNPNPEDPEEYQFIAVGARRGKLFVNDEEVAFITPDSLKTALVKAAKNPGRTRPAKKSK